MNASQLIALRRQNAERTVSANKPRSAGAVIQDRRNKANYAYYSNVGGDLASQDNKHSDNATILRTRCAGANACTMNSATPSSNIVTLNPGVCFSAASNPVRGTGPCQNVSHFDRASGVGDNCCGSNVG